MFTFADSAELLKANGYSPAPLSSHGRVPGPHAMMQVDWSRYDQHANAPVAVLTGTPRATCADQPVQHAEDTWLCTLAVSVADELARDVDAIIDRYVKGAKCPTLVTARDTLRVFRLAGPMFSQVATDSGHDPHYARARAHADHIPVNGEWKDGVNLLNTFRHELAELDHAKAEALVSEINDLLHERAPPVATSTPFVPRPILEPGQRLLWSNDRALDALRDNGYPLLPVRWGAQHAENEGYHDSTGRFVYNVGLDNHGVGVSLKGGLPRAAGLVVIETNTPFRPDWDAVVRSFGPCLIRSAGERRAYLFRRLQGAKCDRLHWGITIRRSGLFVLSGAEAGHDYTWDRDAHTVRLSDLAAFEAHDAQRLLIALESEPELEATPQAKPARKRARVG